ncbi:MAG TPA: TolC family protein [Cyclobacteriaceae bacterium]|jgi:outer membrane protein TolC|nr:TolC family protein [Cyclobacteriaceae bacterium]
MKFLRFLPVLILPLAAHAQSIDYNKIILPDRVVTKNFEERLVQLAWNNHPSNLVVIQNVDIAQKEKGVARWRWLDDIYANGNLNEYTLHPNASLTNVYYPRYNFGVRVTLGSFVNIPLQTRAANGRLINAAHLVNEKKLTVREEILGNLEKLKQYYKFIKIRAQIKEDFRTMYKDAEKKFSTGEINIERYRAAVQAYYDQSELVIEAQANYNGVKIILESLVGVPLPDIEGYKEFISRLDAEAKID